MPCIRGNVGFVFTNGDLSEVREKLLSNKVRAPAKPGALAPSDVIIPAMNTGLGPEKTSFFQALAIATKISKGTIEIINDVHIVKVLLEKCTSMSTQCSFFIELNRKENVSELLRLRF